MLSPMLEKYTKIQKDLDNKYKNCILLMQVGGFYEVYGFDCERVKMGHVKLVTDILNSRMTKKNKSKPHNIDNPYMCGFPCEAVSKHLKLLLKNNLTVAIYNQDKVKKKNKDHELFGIFSPSTYIDEDNYNTNNELMCVIVENYNCVISKTEKYSVYISSIDLSTGKNKVFECHNTKDFIMNEIHKQIDSINPREIISNTQLPDNITNNILIHEVKDSKEFKNIDYQTTFLEKVFGKHNLLNIIEYLNLERNQDLLYCYIHLLQFAYEHDPNIIKKIYKPNNISYSENFLKLNHDAFKELHILQLFDIINKTSTKIGERLLKHRLTNPIVCHDELNKRYNNIEYFKDNTKEYKSLLENISDIEKCHRKMILGQLLPNSFANLNNSYKNIIALFTKLKNNFDIDSNFIKSFKEFYNTYTRLFNLNIMSNCNDYSTSFFNKGCFQSIDKVSDKINTIKSLFNQFEGFLENQRAKVTLCSTDKEGYYLKTTKRAWNDIKNEDRKIVLRGDFKCNLEHHISNFEVSVHSNYVKLRCSALNILEKEQEKHIEELTQLVYDEYKKVCKMFDEKFSDVIQKTCDIIGEIDISVCGSIISGKYNYTKPIINLQNDSYFNFKNIRHPIIEQIHKTKEYITNDISLNDDKKGMILFGLNSSGKSSLMRAVGCNIVLAQIGFYVSASEFEYSPYSSIISKISSTDNLFKAQSTFISEMMELKNLLNTSDENTLVLCDELTSGSEIASSIGIVCSAILKLLERNCTFLFTTHLHGIIKFDNIKNNEKLIINHFKIDMKDGQIQFERKLREGSGDEEYGIEIANYLDLNSDFIKLAYSFRNKFNKKSDLILKNKRSRYNQKVIVDHCEKCGSEEHLHTHHIHEQHTANEKGMIEHFHKNTEHNLMILCEECHKKEHDT